MAGRRDTLKAAARSLRDCAFGYPGATEEFPWGERVAKVNGKVFAFLGRDEGVSELGLSVKLPVSNGFALTQRYAAPTGYGLGRSGWVTVKFAPGDAVPVDLLKQWIDESYRAVAPKRLVATLAAGPTPPARPTRKRRAG